MNPLTTTKPFASIVIRAFNEERHIGKLLQRISQQQTDFPFEVIVVDSGSTDSTLTIAKKYGVRLVHIKPEDFTFGYSLNRGIDASRADFCVFVSAHCYPADPFWLKNILAPFKNPNVALVYGKQRGVETSKYSEHQIFAKWFPEESVSDYQLPFCNNANAAIRRSVWENRKYNEELTGLEDIEWAKQIRAKGHQVAYQADSNVFHVHEETKKQIYTRYYREAFAYKEIFRKEHFTFFDFIKYFLMNTLGDALHALHENKFLKNILGIITFRFCQFWATYRAHAYRTPVSREMAHKLYYPRKPRLLRNHFFSAKNCSIEENHSVALDNAGKSSSAGKTGMTPEVELFDITRPLSSRLPVWPGAKSFNLEWLKSMDTHCVNDSHLSFNTHTGTHMDAPYHFLHSGKRMKDIPLQSFIGEAYVLESTDKSSLDVDFFIKANLPKEIKKLLIKTTNSNKKDSSVFDQDFVAITPESARWLVENGIELIGTDGPSIQSFHDEDNSTHEILLGADVIVLEGLDMSQPSQGFYQMIALPMNIPEAEGAPVRAILTRGKWL